MGWPNSFKVRSMVRLHDSMALAVEEYETSNQYAPNLTK